MSSGMEGDLLRREQEFHKINSELEERTSRILQEINDAKVRQDLALVETSVEVHSVVGTSGI